MGFFTFKVMTPEDRERHHQADPYMIRDGKWGGWGPTSWFVYPERGLGRCVFEVYRRDHESGGTEQYWGRVWDPVIRIWRLPTEWELKKLPELEVIPPFVMPSFDKFVFPKIENMSANLITRDLISVQPMAGPVDIHLFTTRRR